MNRTNLAVGVLFVLFSLIYYFFLIPTQIVSSVSESEFAGRIFRPETFPQLTIMLFGFVSVLLAGSAFREGGGAEILPGSDRRGFSQAMAVFVVGFIYIYALQVFGFMISTPFFLAALVIFFGTRYWPYFVFVPILSTIAVNYFFCFSFKVILPEGEILPDWMNLYFCPAF